MSSAGVSNITRFSCLFPKSLAKITSRHMAWACKLADWRECIHFPIRLTLASGTGTFGIRVRPVYGAQGLQAGSRAEI